MNKIFTLLLLSALAVDSSAQTTPSAQPFGKADIADLQMKACDFEKDANAEVLFNKGTIYYGGDLRSITEEVHKRIKIFNDNGKREADIHIPYYSGNHIEYITGIQAETINLVDGKMEITKLDKKLIYTKAIDNNHSEITFTFPDVKPGSIIEYKYSWGTSINTHMPDWFFQENIPVRYTEFNTSMPDVFYFRAMPRIYSAFVKHTTSSEGRSLQVSDRDGTESYPYNLENETRAIVNIPSLPDEPYMSSFADNVQCVRFQFVSNKPIGGFVKNYSDTWAKVGKILAEDEDFGGQLRRKLSNEEEIINKAKTLKIADDKIAYIFNEVRNTMKWSGSDRWYTVDGTSKAWDNKTGNSAEINLILYHLLKQAGLNVFPMVVSTRKNGKIDRYYTSVDQFNRAVVYLSVDSIKNYVLDATGKYNMYNETPENLLNSFALVVDKSKEIYNLIYLKKDLPARQVILINAEIKAGGKLEGSAQISSTSYNKIDIVNRYKTDGEKKYIDYLRNDDNNLKITALKFENMDVDTLPVTQNINFNLDLAGSDETYIYVNPNLFSELKINPFLSENRMSNIDFRYLRSYSINGVYKIPAGYKTDAMPKNITLMMPDKSVSFKRMVAEQEGTIVVRYSINYNKPEYSKDDYPNLHEFFKKMYEMLNEQIILKKG